MNLNHLSIPIGIRLSIQEEDTISQYPILPSHTSYITDMSHDKYLTVINASKTRKSRLSDIKPNNPNNPNNPTIKKNKTKKSTNIVKKKNKTRRH